MTVQETCVHLSISRSSYQLEEECIENGEVIASTIGEKQDTAFVLVTLAQLPLLPENCVLHSDQGSVYNSYEYQEAVKAKGITMSMSCKETPADNAYIESFHSSLKSETFYSTNETKQPITDMISTIGCLKVF